MKNISNLYQDPYLNLDNQKISILSKKPKVTLNTNKTIYNSLDIKYFTESDFTKVNKEISNAAT